MALNITILVKDKGKGTYVKVWCLHYIHQTIIFPGIGHTPIEQSHLPLENTGQKS